MGGRGSKSMSAAAVPEKPKTITITRDYVQRHGGYWDEDLAGVEVDDSGVMMMYKPDVKSWEKVNKSRSTATYELESAIYTDASHIEMFNADFDKANVIFGETYPFKESIKLRGYKWGPKFKVWYRPGYGGDFESLYNSSDNFRWYVNVFLPKVATVFNSH